MKRNEIKEWYKCWWMIVVYCLVGFMVLGSIFPNDCPECKDCLKCKDCAECKKCPLCECPSQEILENKFIVMCEMYNIEVILINELMDWVDNYANPTSIILTRQPEMNCYNLLEE